MRLCDGGQLVRRVNTASTAVRSAVVSTTHRAVRQRDSATAVTAGPALPAISRVHLTCTGRTVLAPAAVNMEVDVIRSLDCVRVRLDSSENIVSSVRNYVRHKTCSLLISSL